MHIRHLRRCHLIAAVCCLSGIFILFCLNALAETRQPPFPRCTKLYSTGEVRILGNGHRIRFIRVLVSKGEPVLNYDYWSEYLDDTNRRALEEEILDIWKDLRIRAEKEGMKEVFVTARDVYGECTLVHSSVLCFKRNADGDWIRGGFVTQGVDDPEETK